MKIKELLEKISVITEVNVDNLFDKENKEKVCNELKTIWAIFGENSMFYEKFDVFIPMAKVTEIRPSDLFKVEVIGIVLDRLSGANPDEDIDYFSYKKEEEDLSIESIFEYNEKRKKEIQELTKEMVKMTRLNK